MPTQGTDTLSRNLDALRRHNPQAAQAIERASAAPLTWSTTKSGLDTAVISDDRTGRPVALASKYDPATEAAKLTEPLDDQTVASAVVMGFGVGHHAARAAEVLGRAGVLVVYEPDPAVLRGVLERINHAHWLNRPNVFLFVGDVDRAELTARLDSQAATLAQGTRLIAHPPTRRLHETAVTAFSGHVTELMAFCRTNLATALVNAARTCRNLAMNLPAYAAGATTDQLKDAARGRLAVCVSAGPSLVRNIGLLTDPHFRSRVVVIAVQTALKPLLDRGVRPDFVTALDYSPICSRFYEDLPPLPDVTLVAEPKAHHSIPDAFPGPVRLLKSDFADRALGPLARPRQAMKPGATVAHLSVYLAEHLGCDPIALIGQDLGFSDGLYYAPGTAVHRVWEPELSPINTIEMMEWTRVARMRGSIRKREDVGGRPIYSDEQMLTYLKQFERDFKQMAEDGRTILDATEGGMPKAYTQRITLREALERHAGDSPVELPPVPVRLDPARLQRLPDELEARVHELRELRQVCGKATRLLDDMQDALEDSPRLNKLFKQLDPLKQQVTGDLSRVFDLVQSVNVIGAFHRHRNDRLIERSGATDHDKMARQLRRDRDNLKWTGEACGEALSIFEAAAHRAAELARTRPETDAMPNRSEPRQPDESDAAMVSAA
ncbi:MAG: 6-hydroxymethylpterin diphosphokinase MptE-like protein [Planctomycetota bacterium]